MCLRDVRPRVVMAFRLASLLLQLAGLLACRFVPDSHVDPRFAVESQFVDSGTTIKNDRTCLVAPVLKNQTDAPISVSGLFVRYYFSGQTEWWVSGYKQANGEIQSFRSKGNDFQKTKVYEIVIPPHKDVGFGVQYLNGNFCAAPEIERPATGYIALWDGTTLGPVPVVWTGVPVTIVHGK